MAMKTFKYKFSKAITALIYAGIVLCVVGVGLNIYNIIASDLSSSANLTYAIVEHALMFLIPLALGIILVSLLVSSYYSVDDKYFTTCFGIIKSKYDLKQIESILLDRNTNKLSVFFKDKSFIVIVVKDEWYDDFIDALCSANSEIEFSINSKEHHKDDTDEKK